MITIWYFWSSPMFSTVWTKRAIVKCKFILMKIEYGKISNELNGLSYSRDLVPCKAYRSMYCGGLDHHWKWVDGCIEHSWAFSAARVQNWTKNLNCTSNPSEALILTCKCRGSSSMAAMQVLLRRGEKSAKYLSDSWKDLLGKLEETC